MTLQPKRLALASATTAAMLYMLCWRFVAVAPEFSLRLLEDMLHVSLDGMSWRMDSRSLLVGTVLWSVLAGVSAWTCAALYNRFGDSSTETDDKSMT